MAEVRLHIYDVVRDVPPFLFSQAPQPPSPPLPDPSFTTKPSGPSARSLQRSPLRGCRGSGASITDVLLPWQTNTPSEQANSVIMTVNNLTRDFGGVFHGGIEIFGKEWSFGYCENGSGLYACIPKLNPAYTYRESVEMGAVDLQPSEVGPGAPG